MLFPRSRLRSAQSDQKLERSCCSAYSLFCCSLDSYQHLAIVITSANSLAPSCHTRRTATNSTATSTCSLKTALSSQSRAPRHLWALPFHRWSFQWSSHLYSVSLYSCALPLVGRQSKVKLGTAKARLVQVGRSSS